MGWRGTLSKALNKGNPATETWTIKGVGQVNRRIEGRGCDVKQAHERKGYVCSGLQKLGRRTVPTGWTGCVQEGEYLRLETTLSLFTGNLQIESCFQYNMQIQDYSLFLNNSD